MEWSMPVNEILRSEITKLNYTLIPPGFRGDVRTTRLMQDSLAKIIDNLGEQSAKAQGLNKVITTAEKLRNSPSHIFYILKDERGNGGKGEVIGFLKMGHKKLFLFDQHDKLRDVEPLCVLDFYVLRDLQRHGYGKVLFDHMIQDSGVHPKQLAVDGPSEKMAAFLRKNYGFTSLVRQANNFAVAAEFFLDKEAMSSSGRATPVETPSAVGRYSAKKPHSSIANVIHGGTPFNRDSASTNGTREATTAAAAAISTPPPVPEPVAVVAPEEPLERPSSLLIETQEVEERPQAPLSPAPSSVCSSVNSSAAGAATERRDSQVTGQGFFDIKFYHNKLW